MPKVRKKIPALEKEIEDFANSADDLTKNGKEGMIRTTIAFTQEEYKKIKEIANQEDRTLQSQVRHMLKNAFRDI